MHASTTTRRHATSLAMAALFLACSSGGEPTATSFSIDVSVAPASLTVQQGQSGTVTLTLVRGGGFTDAVSASVTGLPSGVTASVNPAQLTGSTASAVVTVNVASSVAPGTYTATITASATGVGAATATYQLTVTETPDYSLSASPTALTVQAGASGAATVDIARTNFTGAVALSLSSPPTGISASFNPASATGATSAMTVSVDASVAPGDYTVTIAGSANGPGNRTATLALTVTAPADYSLSVTPDPQTITIGQSGDVTVNIARTNFTGAVTLSLVSPPAGVTGTFTPASPTGTSSTLTLDVTNAAAVGTHTITVMGAATDVATRVLRTKHALADVAAASGDRLTSFQLMVTPAGSITLSATPSSVQALQGGTANSTIDITRTNFTDAVNLTASGMPAGMTVDFNPASVTANSAVATATVGAAVAAGTYPLTITGSGQGLTDAMTSLSVQVVAAPSVWNVEYQYEATRNPAYFAFQDGLGPWTQVLPILDNGIYKYRMNMASGFGGVYRVDAGSTSGTPAPFIASARTVRALTRPPFGEEDPLADALGQSGTVLATGQRGRVRRRRRRMVHRR